MDQEKLTKTIQELKESSDRLGKAVEQWKKGKEDEEFENVVSPITVEKARELKQNVEYIIYDKINALEGLTGMDVTSIEFKWSESFRTGIKINLNIRG